MIKKLQRKFIILSTVSLLFLLLIIVITGNFISYRTLVDNADRILEMVFSPDGEQRQKRDFKMPDKSDGGTKTETDTKFDEDEKPDVEKTADGKPALVRDEMFFKNPFRGGKFHDSLSESRYFMVILNEDGELLNSNLDFISSVSEEEAYEMAAGIVNSKKEKGFTGSYRYFVRRNEGEMMVGFLDCGKNLSTFRYSLAANSVISLMGFILVSIILILMSKKIITPFSLAYEKQKQFISIAGHEIKTPLTIIDADSELLEMEMGEQSEWLNDIKLQTKRLTNLTNDLLSLSKLEEQGDISPMLDFPISDVVIETLQSFQGLAERNGKKIEADITPMLSFFGDEKEIRQLTGVLLDNAIKYSLSDGKIHLSLEKKGNGVSLSVSNSSETVTPEQAECFFDRFYRTEQSKRSEKGGYGLGLAIAKAVVNNHQGKIRAEVEKRDGGTSIVRIVAVFPRQK